MQYPTERSPCVSFQAAQSHVGSPAELIPSFRHMKICPRFVFAIAVVVFAIAVVVFAIAVAG